jgi:hypothetical protein
MDPYIKTHQIHRDNPGFCLSSGAGLVQIVKETLLALGWICGGLFQTFFQPAFCRLIEVGNRGQAGRVGVEAIGSIVLPPMPELFSAIRSG